MLPLRYAARGLTQGGGVTLRLLFADSLRMNRVPLHELTEGRSEDYPIVLPLHFQDTDHPLVLSSPGETCSSSIANLQTLL